MNGFPDYLQTAFDRVTLDSATESAAAKAVTTFDAASAVADYVETDLRMMGVKMVMSWVETPAEDLDEGETLADRLIAMIVEGVDEDGDDDLNDDEIDALNIAAGGAWDYLVGKGVSEADADLLLNEGDEDAGVRVRDALVDGMGDGETEYDNAYLTAVDSMEGASLDAITAKLRGKMTVGHKHGRKKIVHHMLRRIRRTGKQRAAFQKARRRSHSGNALKLNKRSNLLTRRVFGGRRKVVG